MQQHNGHMAIVFDFGGVLVDWNPHHLYDQIFGGDRAAVERFLAEIDFYQWGVGVDLGRPFGEAVQELCERFPHYADKLQIYSARWIETVAGPIAPTVEILRELKAQGYPLYGLSNWSDKFPLVRRQYEFFDWFDDMVVSCDVRLVKPDPPIFRLLLERIGRPARECLFIDDLPANVAAAAALGFRTIRYESPDQLRRALADAGILESRQ